MYLIKESIDDVYLMNRFFEVSKLLAENNREFSFNASGNKSSIWPKYKIFINKKRQKITGKPHQCYNNSLILSNEGFDIAGGLFINKILLEELLNQAESQSYKYSYMIGGFCGPHAWNLDKSGYIVDTTLDSSKYIYVGEKLNKDNFSKWQEIESYVISRYNKGKQNKDWTKIDVYN